MEKLNVIIDNGHGINTPGKCSPDGTLHEWLWTRRTARVFEQTLISEGFGAVLLVPEDIDIPLSERVRRANGICLRQPNSILISLHTNACGSGERWCEASGWSAFVAPDASEQSRCMAKLLTMESEVGGLGGNRVTPTCGYWTARLAICSKTVCPAVLTENLFHDNRADASFLLDERSHGIIADVHCAAIKKYVKHCLMP